MMKLSGKLETGQYIEHDGMEWCKVKAFLLEPGPSSKDAKVQGNLTIDGEKIDYSATYVEVFPSLATIFCPLYFNDETSQ